MTDGCVETDLSTGKGENSGGEPRPSRPQPRSSGYLRSSQRRGEAMDFPQHSKQVLEQLNQQRQLGLLCDCTFVVDGIDFKAHKAVLAACSEYFRMLFVDQKDVVHLDISNAAGLGQVLEFMYTAKLSLNPDNVEDVLAVAGFLQMQEIVSACNALKSLAVPGESPAKSQQPPAGIGANKATVEGKRSTAEALGDLDKIKRLPPNPEGKEEAPVAASSTARGADGAAGWPRRGRCCHPRGPQRRIPHPPAAGGERGQQRQPRGEGQHPSGRRNGRDGAGREGGRGGDDGGGQRGG
ncbi:PREDICTED: zinc finger and BTB domain-containing protein 17 [Pygoscelis adeliae]|uniref:zinc finger and BTB domain-containing protein 17 n=1 Tax=Pygoscelis adeliae TaxID=9238 RepID=UPI0004F5060A|nr:PREDICTED: zinc finger and BTB domain-containing protein 17 [Pygoscelis adeliae]